MTTSPGVRPHSRRAKLLLVLGALVLALLVGEAVCRVRAQLRNQSSMQVAFSKKRHLENGERVALLDIIQVSPNPKIVFELKPGLEAVNFKGAPVTTNRFGFRGPEIEVEEGPDTVTIVGLGDSIMFGWGVGDGTNYLCVLERMLQRKYPAKQWRVINMAAPAYNTVMEVEALRSKGLQFGPDLVILSLVPNDLVLPQYVRVVEDVFDLKRSYLLELIFAGTGWGGGPRVDRREGRDPRLVHHSNQTFDGEVPEEYRQLVGWEPFRAALRQLQDLSQEHGFSVVSFSTVEDALTAELIQASRDQGFPHVALLPKIQQYMAEHHQARFSAEEPDAYMHSALVVRPTDGHPSVKQHWMAAEELLTRLEEQGCIARLME